MATLLYSFILQHSVALYDKQCKSKDPWPVFNISSFRVRSRHNQVQPEVTFSKFLTHQTNNKLYIKRKFQPHCILMAGSNGRQVPAGCKAEWAGCIVGFGDEAATVKAASSAETIAGAAGLRRWFDQRQPLLRLQGHDLGQAG